MCDAAGNYDLKVEFLESNDFIGKKVRSNCLPCMSIRHFISFYFYFQTKKTSFATFV